MSTTWKQQHNVQCRPYHKMLANKMSEISPLFLSFFLSLSQLEAELALCEREGAELQEYANQVLQQIADRCPDILEQVVNALEDSS